MSLPAAAPSTTGDDDDPGVGEGNGEAPPPPSSTTTNVAASSSSSDVVVDRIDLLTLLSTCVDASARGCDVIRSVRETRRKKASSSSSSGSEGAVRYKVEGDVRSALTEADVSSQEIIVRCLRSKWGDGLRIVGEEDDASTDAPATDEDPFAKYSIDDPSVRPLSESHVPPPSSSASRFAPSSDVVVFVDPLDGTREFVEGRIKNVRCLVGITVKGVPMAGVVAVPFSGGKSVDVYYGLIGDDSGGGAYGKVSVDASSTVTLPNEAEPPAASSDDDDGKVVKKQRLEAKVTILTGDSQNSALLLAVRCLQTILTELSIPHDNVVAGGCGNKMMRLATGGGGDNSMIAVMGPGTCSWDTAAPTAVLYAAARKDGDDDAAKVTDFFGNDLTYDGTDVDNDSGVIASRGLPKGLHERICRTLATSNDDGDMKALLKEWKERRP